MITDDEKEVPNRPHGNMLRPFKSLLTYLQKGSPNSSSMANYTDVKPGDDEGSEANGDDDGLLMDPDPLMDPLAIDTDYSALLLGREEITASATSSSSSRYHQRAGSGDEEEDDGEGASAEIVFVDIDRLKRKRIGLEVPPAVPLPGSGSSAPLVVARPDPQEGDRLKPGVEAPGTASSTAGGGGEDGESRSDGSDSGLGSDLLNLNAPCDQNPPSPPVLEEPLTVSILKRPAIQPPDEDDDDLGYRSALKRASLEKDAKRPRRNIQFENVTTYYFPRIQGFVCVPSQGGCTLGMESNHIYKKSVTLNEHLAEQRRAHRQQLEQLNPNCTRSQHSSSDDSEEDACSDVNGSDVDTESTGFLRPVSTKQRRVLLKAAGVRKIETAEKDECRIIRTSREVCGCRCQGYCDPDLCHCSVNGIKCQVDRVNFPCSCTRESCGNAVGRVEFNPMRVRTHYIHTVMRLELEAKQLLTELETASSASTLHSDLGGYSRPFQSRSSALLNGGRSSGGSSQFLESIAIPTRSEAPIGDQEVDYDDLLSHKTMLSIGKTPMPDSPLDFHFAYREEFAALDAARNHHNHSSRMDYDFTTVASSSSGDGRGGSGGAGSSSSSVGSQFCNNILQGIQSAASAKSPLSLMLPAHSKDFMRNGADDLSDESSDLNTPQGPYTPPLTEKPTSLLPLPADNTSSFNHSSDDVDTPFKAFESLKQLGIELHGSGEAAAVLEAGLGGPAAISGHEPNRTGVAEKDSNSWPAPESPSGQVRAEGIGVVEAAAAAVDQLVGNGSQV